MPNTYSKLGAQIGDIFATAPRAQAKGYNDGVDAGSQHMLRSAQSAQSGADTEKILYELGMAQKADATTGPQIAKAMGVPDNLVQSLKMGETSTPSLNPAMPGTPIPQMATDKFNNANTLKILQQLSGGAASGGNADTLAAALLKGQDLGTMYNMQGGQQKPYDVATMKAAMEGKLPGRTGEGGGASVTANVQEIDKLTGMGLPENRVLGLVYGFPEAEAWNQAFVRAYSVIPSVPQAVAAADAAEAKVRQSYTPEAPAAVPKNIVKVYK